MFFRRRTVGKTSWTLICSTVVYILALLLISPLSSALLASEEMVLPQSVSFTKLVPRKDSQFSMDTPRETYFRTMGSLTRNLSTSAWISDNSATLPFWPTNEKMQLSSEIVSPHSSWQAETSTYSHNYDCQDMTLVSDSIRNHSFSQKDWHGYMLNDTQPLVSFVLQSDDGCKYELDGTCVYKPIHWYCRWLKC